MYGICLSGRIKLLGVRASRLGVVVGSTLLLVSVINAEIVKTNSYFWRFWAFVGIIAQILVVITIDLTKVMWRPIQMILVLIFYSFFIQFAELGCINPSSYGGAFWGLLVPVAILIMPVFFSFFFGLGILGFLLSRKKTFCKFSIGFFVMLVIKLFDQFSVQRLFTPLIVLIHIVADKRLNFSLGLNYHCLYNPNVLNIKFSAFFVNL